MIPARRVPALVVLLAALLLGAGCASNSAVERRGPAQPVSGHTPVVGTVAHADMVAEAEPPADAARPARKPAADTAAPPIDVWDRIRARMSLPAIDSPYVAKYERWYAERPEYVERMVARASLYLFHIVEEVEKRGMPGEIALLPAIESAYRPQAYSHAHAAGLWQFIPSTGRLYGLKQNWWYDGRRDVIAATDAALNYLETLHAEFGDWHLALAAYNAGENRIRRSLAYNKRHGMPLDYQALDLKLETEQYVPKLIAVANIVRDPAAYGLALAPIPNEPHFTVVDAGEQTDLGIVAELSNTSVEELFALNPGYSRWATAPGGPHRLLVRVGLEDSLSTALARLPDEKRMQWRRYEVRRGDTLAQIARHYGTTVAAIQSTNRIRGHIIRAGDDLLIPVTSRTAPAARTVASRSTIPAPARATGAGGSTKPVVHRVRRGDTLWGIARRYNVYIQQLASWNGIGTSEILRLGQALHVWPN